MKKVDLEAEKKILKDIHMKMLLDHTTDVDEEMSYISDDAFIIPPNSPPLKGSQAIRAALERMVKAKVVTMGNRKHGPSDVWISSSRDLAFDRGSFQIVREGSDGPIEEKGYYVTLYKKVDGVWKFVGQIWNNID